jgi:hypothetical protein
VVGAFEGKEVGGLCGLSRVRCGCGHGRFSKYLMHGKGYAGVRKIG